MVKQNKITVLFKKRKTALIFFILMFAYTVFFAFLENPLENTISIIGKHHPNLFVLYCFLYGAGMLINFQYMFRVHKIKAPFLRIIAYAFNLSMGLVATTLLPNYTIGATEPSLFATIVHWIVGFGGIVVNCVVALVPCLMIYNRTKKKSHHMVVIVGSVVCCLVLAVFVIMTIVFRDPQKSKNGIYEIIPILVSFVTVFLLNHTDIFSPRSERDAEESSLKADDNSVLTAVSYASLFVSWILFTTYAFIRSPIRFTISMIGIYHPTGFAFVCLSLAVSMALNFILMFKRHGYKNYFIIALSVISSAVLTLCVLKPTTMGENIDIIHVISALLFFFGIMGTLLIFLLSNIKANKLYKPFAIALAVIAVAVTAALVLLFIIFKQKYGRTGLTELIPLEFMFLFFYLENFTGYFESEKSFREKRPFALVEG